MDQVQVDIVQTQALERGVNALGDTLVPGVVQLGGDPDLLARNTGFADTVTNLGLIAIGESATTVNATLAAEGNELTCRCDGNPSEAHS